MTLRPDGHTFVLSDEVTRTPVSYVSRYGIEIVSGAGIEGHDSRQRVAFVASQNDDRAVPVGRV